MFLGRQDVKFDSKCQPLSQGRAAAVVLIPAGWR